MNDLGTKKGCLLLNEVPGLVAHTIKQEKEIKGIPIRKKCFVHWTYQCQHHGCDMVLKFYKMLPLGQGTTRLVQNWERSTSRLYAVTLLESKSEVAQSCPTLCEPMDCSPPCSSVHGVFQVRVLEWVAISFSRGSSRPRDGTQVSHIADGFFIIWATKEDQNGGLEWVNLIQMTIISTLIGKNPSEEME